MCPQDPVSQLAGGSPRRYSPGWFVAQAIRKFLQRPDFQLDRNADGFVVNLHDNTNVRFQGTQYGLANHQRAPPYDAEMMAPVIHNEWFIMVTVYQ